MLSRNLVRWGFKSESKGTVPAEPRTPVGHKKVEASSPSDSHRFNARPVVRCRRPARPEDKCFEISEATSSDAGVCVKVEALPSGAAAFWCSSFVGPDADAPHEALLSRVRAAVDGVVQGSTGVILSFGTRGSGMTCTIAGKTEPKGKESPSFVQSVAQRLFDLAHSKAAHGHVFVIEVSFLEIDREGALTDLLTDHGRKLQVLECPLNPTEFVCDGLRRVPVHSAKEVCSLLVASAQRSSAVAGPEPSSNRVFSFNVESLSMGTDGHSAERGKLMIADIAVPLADAPPLGQCHSLPALLQGSAAGPGASPSPLVQLLKGPLASSAEAWLVANISPELQHAEESIATLEFAQRVLMENATKAVVEACVGAAAKVINDARERELSQAVATSATISEQKSPERQLSADGAADAGSPQMGAHAEPTGEKNALEEIMARVEQAKDALREAEASRRAFENETIELHARLATSEERAKLLQEQYDDSAKDRTAMDDERKSLRDRADQMRQKRAATESELVRLRAQVEVGRGELARLNASHAEELETIGSERDARRAKEVELEETARDLQRQTDEVKHEQNLKVLKAGMAKDDTVVQLRQQVQRLERQVADSAGQLSQVKQLHAKLEVEQRVAAQREEAMRTQGPPGLAKVRLDLDEAKVREEELKNMLNELQEELLVAVGHNESAQVEG